MDGMYNSISKNSSYFIPATQEKAKEYTGKNIDLALKAKDSQTGDRYATLLQAAGMNVESAAEEMQDQRRPGRDAGRRSGRCRRHVCQ
jgi:hypothetical protein